MRPFKNELKHGYLILLIVGFLSVSYLALAGSTVGLTTVQWDEYTDLVISIRLSEQPLSGHSFDGSQARLPMYVTAAAYRIIKLFNPGFDLLDLLLPSRVISIIMTVLAIWGTYILGRILFNTNIGLIAASLFTFSPFVLHFGRDALTQGDAFTTATVVFTLITFVQFTNKRSTFWLAMFSFFLAMAIASKFFLVILIPAFMTFQVIIALSKRYRQPNPFADAIDFDVLKIDWSFTFLAIGTGFMALFAWAFAFWLGDQPSGIGRIFFWIARFMWCGALLGILLIFLLVIKKFRDGRTIPDKSNIAWRFDGAWIAILPLSCAIVLALFPAHIFNPFVLSTLFERSLTLDGNTDFLVTFLDSIRLYTGLLLFKLGLPFGMMTYLALAWAGIKSTTHKGFLLIILVIIYYGLLLAILPLQQSFWLMSIYPLVIIILSALIVEVLQNLSSPWLRLIGASYVVLAIGWLLVGLIQVYPTFGFYGYEILGNQWLGGESRGYAGVVVITNDGSTEAIEWLRHNSKAGSVVLSYLDDPHIINYLDSVQPFTFDLKHAQQYTDIDDLNREIAEAEYVVVRAINDTDLNTPLTKPAYIGQFSSEPVYQVLRGRGIYHMPLIQIYKRVSEPNVLK